MFPVQAFRRADICHALLAVNECSCSGPSFAEFSTAEHREFSFAREKSCRSAGRIRRTSSVLDPSQALPIGISGQTVRAHRLGPPVT